MSRSCADLASLGDRDSSKMLLHHSQVLQPLYVQQPPPPNRPPGVYATKYVENYQPVSCSLLQGLNLKLAFDYSERRFCLSWNIDSSSKFEPLDISRGTISISGLHGEEWDIPLHGPIFPFVPSATLRSHKIPSTCQSAEITVELSAPGESSSPEIASIASSATASHLSRELNNVCFFFPRTQQRIWSNESVLRKSSPYFETLFSSDFAEASASPSSPLEQSSPRSPPPPYDYDDSDVDTHLEEAPLLEPDLMTKREEEKGFETFPFKTIRVLDTTYNTYLAVLVWISTQHIMFAPLKSRTHNLSSFGDSPTAQRQKAVSKLRQESKPGLPTPVSPKSVYRLAHLLELADLQALALTNFKSQLTNQGAFYELYGDVSCTYSAVQAVAMEYVVKNWNLVKESAAARKVKQKLDNGEGSSAMALIGFELSKELMKKYGPK
ncbi:uncharacterized protein JCM6883_002125 [Sporobolomyces salmoneus]|uniref:uncharacterized protein n=1 Tax=Sporobolomyces salmoneus TaxID=183962 RepID=UPI00317F3619